jgi:hypothetical protein
MHPVFEFSSSLLDLPRIFVVRCSTWDGEGHKTKTHACVTALYVKIPFAKYRYTRKIVQLVTVVFANGSTYPARDARVRLGLVALPFPSRASGDKIRGRYSIRREVTSHSLQGESNPSVIPPTKVVMPLKADLLVCIQCCSESARHKTSAVGECMMGGGEGWGEVYTRSLVTAHGNWCINKTFERVRV